MPDGQMFSGGAELQEEVIILSHCIPYTLSLIACAAQIYVTLLLPISLLILQPQTMLFFIQ